MPFDPDDLNKKNNFGNGLNKPNNDNDDFVGSSFAVQFKPGDPANSVSDKLKESQNGFDQDFDSFKDEFDDFILDDTISAFKPISNDGEAAKPAFTPEAEEPKAKEAAPAAKEEKSAAPEKKEDSDIPAFPKNGGTFDRKPSDDVSNGPDKTNTPVFGSDGKAESKLSEAEQKKEEKLFKSGNNLDYATSEHDKSKSPFANAKRPEMPEAEGVDIPRAEKKPEVKTYGKVSSGVNAFGSDKLPEIPEMERKEEKASPFVIRPTPTPRPAVPKAPESKQVPPAPQSKPAHQAPAAAKAAQAEKPAPAAPAAHTPPAAAKAVQTEKPAQPAPAAHTPPAAAKAAQAEKPVQAAPAAHTPPAAAKASQTEKAVPAAAAANDKATVGQRPGEIAKQSAPAFSRPAPTGAAIDSIRPEDARRVLAVEKSQNAASSVPHEKPNISPVTVRKTKNKKESKSAKDPGVGGIITLVVIIVAFIGILLLLQNLDKIGTVFGRKPVETLPTIQTTTTAATVATTTEATTTTEETTTEATTESTTEATTEATTTTTEATTTTTKATTKATKATAKKSTSSGIATKAFKTNITGFKRTSTGFSFTVVMKNNSGKTASLKKSLRELDLQLMSTAPIKSLSSKYFTFKVRNGWWVGTPKDALIKAGDKLTITINVKTNGKTKYFGYKKSYFGWN